MTRATQHPTTVRNRGVNGSGTADLLRALRPGSDTARRLSGAAIVTVTIGANDMAVPRQEWARDGCGRCFAKTAAVVRTNLAKILHLVRVDSRRSRVEILVTTYWNVFEEAAVDDLGETASAAYTKMADAATRVTNAAICGAAASQRGAACIDLYRPFKGNGSKSVTRLLAADGDHPNGAGHRLIAVILARHAWRELGFT